MKLNRLCEFIFFVLPFALIAALRGHTYDTDVYVGIFNSTFEFPTSATEYYAANGVEWMFGFLSWMVNFLGLNHRVFLFTYSFGTIFFIFLSTIRLNINFIYVLPYYIGPYYLSLQNVTMRQGLGVSFIFFIAILAIEAKKLKSIKYYVIGLVIGPLIHSVTIAPLLSSWAVKFIKVNYRNRLYTYTIVFIFIVLICNLIIKSGLLSEFGRIDTYINNDEYGSQRVIYSIVNIKSFFILISMLLLSNKKLFDNLIYNRFLLIYCIGFATRIGLSDISILSARVGSAIGFVEIYLIPLFLLTIIKNKFLIIVISLLYMMLNIIYFTNFVYPDFYLNFTDGFML